MLAALKLTAVVAVTLILLEVGLHTLARLPFSSHRLKRVQEILNNETVTRGDESCWENSRWKKRFVREFRDSSFFQSGLLEVEPTLGWLPRAGQLVHIDGLPYTTNREQERVTSLKPSAEKEVWVFGDSFTFGMDAADEASWPYLLQNKLPGRRVRNLAVPGYGLDQMYLRLRKSLEKGKPTEIIIAVNLDDFLRTSLSFRDYQKPLFEVRNEELLLTNTPIPNPEALYRELSVQLASFQVMTGALLQNIFSAEKHVVALQQTCHKNSLQVSRLLMEQIISVAQTDHINLTFIYLSKFEENQTENFISVGENFFTDAGSVLESRFLNLRLLFLKRGWEELNQASPLVRPGHYTLRENELVAESIRELVF